MQTAAKRLYSEDEYLGQERRSLVKHEFINGEIFEMAGASTEHNLIGMNLGGVLRDLLKARPCIVLGSDQRIHIPATGMYTYPDLSVVCGKPIYHVKDRLALTNPLVLVEVLSESTEADDRGAKFAHYRTITSLREVLLVAQDEQRIDHYRRLDSGQWLLTECTKGELSLQALGCVVSLADVYEKVELLR